MTRIYNLDSLAEQNDEGAEPVEFDTPAHASLFDDPDSFDVDGEEIELPDYPVRRAA